MKFRKHLSLITTFFHLLIQLNSSIHRKILVMKKLFHHLFFFSSFFSPPPRYLTCHLQSCNNYYFYYVVIINQRKFLFVSLTDFLLIFTHFCFNCTDGGHSIMKNLFFVFFELYNIWTKFLLFNKKKNSISLILLPSVVLMNSIRNSSVEKKNKLLNQQAFQH